MWHVLPPLGYSWFFLKTIGEFIKAQHDQHKRFKSFYTFFEGGYHDSEGPIFSIFSVGRLLWSWPRSFDHFNIKHSVSGIWLLSLLVSFLSEYFIHTRVNILHCFSYDLKSYFVGRDIVIMLLETRCRVLGIFYRVHITVHIHKSRSVQQRRNAKRKRKLTKPPYLVSINSVHPDCKLN